MNLRITPCGRLGSLLNLESLDCLCLPCVMRAAVEMHVQYNLISRLIHNRLHNILAMYLFL